MSTFEQIVAWDNLRLAAVRALRGKRHRPEAREFVSQLDSHLQTMREQLLAGTVLVGEFRQFVIHDPKERIITAPCFRERVLHHTVVNMKEQWRIQGYVRYMDDTLLWSDSKAALRSVLQQTCEYLTRTLARVVDRWELQG